ncbi:hypothetical protein MMC19_005024 [Ptychographa xylographoides]|nr:hypothetical protein [Ptychographa xylographoides]
MPPILGPASTGLTITNPLVLYRALLATKRIDPDPAQHRLALHLQKLYFRLKDYEPEIEYRQRLDEISRAVGTPAAVPTAPEESSGRSNGVFGSFRRTAGGSADDVLALTRKLTSHDSAVQVQSPKGLLLYGEVGTGKSMLVDLLADCLPNRKKRRWHFNTFMLETFARLEQLRRSRLGSISSPAGLDGQEPEHSLLCLARDMISTSPILFLDEFQLPDRAASKILSNLLTSFFHLGGVLIATSNRIPEELANASGVEFAPPPASRLGLLGNRWGLLGAKGSEGGKSESMFSGKGDFAAFLDVLKARCEVWDMEGERDWRRREAEGESQLAPDEVVDQVQFDGLEPMVPGNWGLGYEQSVHRKPDEQNSKRITAVNKSALPKNYFVTPSAFSTEQDEAAINEAWQIAMSRSISESSGSSLSTIPWKITTLRVYGRNVLVPRSLGSTTMWTFSELCASNLGPADYISLASNFHTLILTDVPILTLLQKNEARRLITLLDALYEARCKLLIRAAAGPDDLFFPETKTPTSENGSEDGTYAETFSEIYQDQTSPFRPNISSYTSSASTPSYASSPLPSTPYSQNSNTPSLRSMLADEDSDFGPVYGAGRSPGSGIHPSEPVSQYRNTRGPGDGAPGTGNEIGRNLDFQRTGIFTGEDEKFAYKRARSRLWEMCGAKWWAREDEGWWKPVGIEIRRWETSPESMRKVEVIESVPVAEMPVANEMRAELKANEDDVFRHGASPFRTSQEPPPKIPWAHAWGMMTWGKKAGAWGKGVEGLEERDKRKSSR